MATSWVAASWIATSWMAATCLKNYNKTPMGGNVCLSIFGHQLVSPALHPGFSDL